MDALYCKLDAMDPHFQCARGGAQTKPGLICAPPRLLDSAIQRLRHGNKLILLGDSISLQMWVTLLLLVSERMPELRCPDLSQSYRGEWGSDGQLQCARAANFQLCYAKAGVVPSVGRKGRAHRTSAAEVLRALMRDGSVNNQTIVVVNFGLHYEDRRAELVSEAIALANVHRSRTAPTIVWRETSPQHFQATHPFSEGDSHVPSWWRDEHASRCSPLAPDDANANKFNEATNPIMTRAGVPLLKVWHATAQDWSTHLSRTTNRESASITDCTHFCVDTSGALRSWALGLLAAICGADEAGWEAAAVMGSTAVSKLAAEARQPRPRDRPSHADPECKVSTSARVTLRLFRSPRRNNRVGGVKRK
ncbi:hypothetical protein AB1Y20_023293 [Prymnesium parvum]|uniref:Uncharacterized protein n=1 Tax=Prymnesium parvum TaxID=97485 RepID=A0AB34JDL0_PRYPA